MKKGFYMIPCIMISISLTGCWSRKEPKTLALVNSVIYDLTDTGGYQTTIEVINPSAEVGIKNGGSVKNPNITATSEGTSLPEALRDVSESLERIIFGGHNKVRFFSERFAQNGMASTMDYLLRDRLTDEIPLIMIIKSKDPKQIYSCMLGLSDTVGDYLESMSETQPDIMSKSVFIKTLDFIKDYYNEGKQPVAGVVELVECDSKPSNNTGTDPNNLQGAQSGSDKEYRIKYEGLAAFKDGKLVGYMDGGQTRAYNFITNNLERIVVAIASQDSQTVVSIRHAKAHIKTEIKNGHTIIHVKIKAEISIIQKGDTIDISKIEPLKAIETDFNNQMAQEIAAAIQKAQMEFQSDIFGFGTFVHRQHPKEWKKIKDNWDDYFTKAVVDVSVESSIDRSGEIKQPFGLES